MRGITTIASLPGSGSGCQSALPAEVGKAAGMAKALAIVGEIVGGYASDPNPCEAKYSKPMNFGGAPSFIEGGYVGTSSCEPAGVVKSGEAFITTTEARRIGTPCRASITPLGSEAPAIPVGRPTMSERGAEMVKECAKLDRGVSGPFFLRNLPTIWVAQCLPIADEVFDLGVVYTNQESLARQAHGQGYDVWVYADSELGLGWEIRRARDGGGV